MGLTNIVTKFLSGGSAIPKELKVPAGRRVYAIGDIHGRVDLLDALHAKILDDANSVEASQNVIVYLGDYVDRGLESKTVIDRLLRSPCNGFQHVHLKGNHESLMLEFLENSNIGPEWMAVGGKATLLSYGVRSIQGSVPLDTFDEIQEQLKSNLPDPHLRFLNDLRLRHTEGDYLFVHAGVRPGRKLDEQDDRDLMWIREPFLSSREWHGKMIVHGHSTGREPEILPNRIGVDTAAYATGVLTCLVLWEDKRSFICVGR